jgi:hypothetical protein
MRYDCGQQSVSWSVSGCKRCCIHRDQHRGSLPMLPAVSQPVTQVVTEKRVGRHGRIHCFLTQNPARVSGFGDPGKVRRPMRHRRTSCHSSDSSPHGRSLALVGGATSRIVEILSVIAGTPRCAACHHTNRHTRAAGQRDMLRKKDKHRCDINASSRAVTP